MASAPRFTLRCWGARGTIPSPGPHALRYGGHTACLEIRPANGARIVFDAGSGIRALGAHMLRAQTESDTGPIHLFLTHRHLDHVIGLPHFQPLRAEQCSVVLRCGNATRDEVHKLVDTLLAPPLFVPLPALRNALCIESCESGVPMAVGPDCWVHRLEARHNGGAAIFRLDDAAGPAIAFAPDNELSYASADPSVHRWRAGLAEALRNVRVLVHDAMYNANELDHYVGWGHSSAEEATRFALECGAGQLVLFHHHPDRADDAVDALVTTCRTHAAREGSALEIVAAYEGMTLAL